jgi:hypothetical protein
MPIGVYRTYGEADTALYDELRARGDSRWVDPAKGEQTLREYAAGCIKTGIFSVRSEEGRPPNPGGVPGQAQFAHPPRAR